MDFICAKCDIKEVVSIVNKEKGSITYNDVKKFLCTIDEICKDNSEYSAFRNEALFDLLIHKPEIVVKVLSNEPKINSNYIYEILKNPIDDSIDLKKIQLKFDNVEGSKVVKDQILKSIKVAIEKS